MKRVGVRTFRVLGGRPCTHPVKEIIKTVFGQKYCKKCKTNIKNDKTN